MAANLKDASHKISYIPRKGEACMRGSNGRLAFGAFMGGVGLGVIVSLLFAPQSGEETRDMIAQKARRAHNLLGDAADRVGDAVGSVTDAVDDIRSQVSDTVEDAKSRVRDAVEAGKEAYHDQLRRSAHA